MRLEASQGHKNGMDFYASQSCVMNEAEHVQLLKLDMRYEGTELNQIKSNQI